MYPSRLMKVKVSKEKMELMCLKAGWIKSWSYKDIPDFIELEAEPVNGVDKIVNDWIELADHPKLPEELSKLVEELWGDNQLRPSVIINKINEIIRYLKARE